MITRSCRADSRQKSKAGLDALFRRKVKARDGYRCQVCGSGSSPECAHFFPRARLATRWRLDCATTLCGEHHRYFTKRPNAWTDRLIAQMGRARYDELQALSLRVKAVDYGEIRVTLEAA